MMFMQSSVPFDEWKRVAMRAAWYDVQGPASDVFRVAELPDPTPGPGEVRVRVSFSGINPGDTKKRRGWLGSSMPYPRVIPHSDGAGVIDAVGEGIEPNRVGRRVWVYGAQSYRAFGTAAELVVVPSEQAVDLPDEVSDEVGACLGIPGITAHRAVFSDGPVRDQTIVVQGALGGVGSLAAQLAHWGGATVIGTVRHRDDVAETSRLPLAHVVSLDQRDAVDLIRSYAPAGITRIIEVDFSDNIEFDAAIASNNTVIAAYAAREDQPTFPFWTMLFDNITIRLFGSDDFPIEAKRQAAADLTTVAPKLSLRIGRPLPLASAAEAHDRVDAGSRDRVLLALGNYAGDES
jgi:NADPH2:quinone reductase